MGLERHARQSMFHLFIYLNYFPEIYLACLTDLGYLSQTSLGLVSKG
jgi:hypothetical protein